MWSYDEYYCLDCNKKGIQIMIIEKLKIEDIQGLLELYKELTPFKVIRKVN